MGFFGKKGWLNADPTCDVYTLIETLSRVFFSRYPDANRGLGVTWLLKLSADFYQPKTGGQCPDRKSQRKSHYPTFPLSPYSPTIPRSTITENLGGIIVSLSLIMLSFSLLTSYVWRYHGVSLKNRIWTSDLKEQILRVYHITYKI